MIKISFEHNSYLKKLVHEVKKPTSIVDSATQFTAHRRCDSHYGTDEQESYVIVWDLVLNTFIFYDSHQSNILRFEKLREAGEPEKKRSRAYDQSDTEIVQRVTNNLNMRNVEIVEST